MLTAGIDLAAQPAKTGAVLVDWSSEPPTVVRAWRKVTDEQILALCEEVTRQRGRVGIDCPLGWPRPFVDFVTAHAANQPLPTTELSTQPLRLRATDIALVQHRRGRPPLSVSTNMLGVTALRAARLLAELRERRMPVNRAGRGTVCEVYPAASRSAWGLTRVRDLTELLSRLPLEVMPPAERTQLDNEHIFDALVAALTARAVAVGATDLPPPGQADLAAEEGWIHVPSPGHDIAQLAGRAPMLD